MWIMILLVFAFAVVLGRSGWGKSQFGGWSWSPAIIIVLAGVVLYFTGHLTWQG
jgi:membrane protein YdbS with pleckstrin-like domain